MPTPQILAVTQLANIIATMPVPGWGEAGERRCARGGAVVREGVAKQNPGSRDRKKWEWKIESR